MLFILNNNTDPYFNIAAEDYLLHSFSDDVFMLYRNRPSIIVGKHQNTFSEINYWYVKENNISVVRRLSGGGTVFHDLGNLNFLFIQNGKQGALVDFVKFTDPILQALLQLGVPAFRSGRNDLLAEGLKISGNAEHVYKNRTLHHGTLLFSSNLDDLRQGLNSNPENCISKSVQSVRSMVTNICNYVSGIKLEEFIEKIYISVKANSIEPIDYWFSQNDISEINKLAKEKYATWEWNYGYSPKCTMSRQGEINKIPINIWLEIEKGLIISIQTDILIPELKAAISLLTGMPYNDDLIQEKLSKHCSSEITNSLLRILF